MTFKRLSVTTGLLIGLGSIAHSGFTNPFVPAFRGMPNTEYGQWEDFSFAFDGANQADVADTTGGATVENYAPTAFLTGGNIYAFDAALDLALVDTVPGDLQEVLLQLSTKGEELDYAGVALEYTDGQGVLQLLPWTSRSNLASTPGVGIEIEELFEWDLSAIPDEVTDFRILFEAAAPSMSLDAVTLDTRFETVAATYCTAKTNSQGCTSSIGWVGTPSSSAGAGFEVRAQNVLPGTVGILIYGTNGKAATPFQGGTLCLAAPVKRTSPQASGGAAPCTGSFSFDFNVLIEAGADADLVGGQVVHAQYWSRDTGFAPPNASNLTDGLEFTIQS